MGDRRNIGDRNPQPDNHFQDLVALEWVRGEIAETLNQARQSLEAYVSNPQDTTRLRFCQNYLHQVHGTLEMVEFYGASLLAEEMENLLQTLLDGTLTSQDEALSVLMQGILQLPPYLEQVQTSQQDLPVVILPILNDLRSARGENLLSESALFKPDLSACREPVPEHVLSRINISGLQPLLRKIRQTYQLGLVSYLKDPAGESGKSYLHRVFTRLETLSEELPAADLWPVADALIIALDVETVTASSSIRNLLRQIDKFIAQLISEGAPAFNRPPPEDILKNCLYYISQSNSTDPKVLAVHKRFSLAQALPDDQTLKQNRQRLSGVDQSTLTSVSKVLSEELLTVKDALDLYGRNPDMPVSKLSAQLPPMRQIADTLAILGQGVSRKIILDQVEKLSEMINSQSRDNSQLMDIAGSLLYVEATLSGINHNAGKTETGQDELATGLKGAREAVVEEACYALNQAKEAISDFISSQWKKDCLHPVPELLKSVQGSLEMIHKPQAASIVHRVCVYVEIELLQSEVKPLWQNLENLAEALSGVEYYLERSGDRSDIQGQRILEHALTCLEQLTVSAQAVPADENPESVQPEADDTDFILQLDDTSEPLFSVEPIETEETIELAADEDFEFEIVLEDDAVSTADFTESDLKLDHTEDFSLLNDEEELSAPVIPVAEVEESDDELDEELIEIFSEEATEVQEVLARYFPVWQQDQQNEEALKELRRGFHTLKGSGRMVNALVIGELSWAVENMLNRVIDNTIASHQGMMNLVAQVIDLLPQLIDDFTQRNQQETEQVRLFTEMAVAFEKGESFQPVPDVEQVQETIPAEEYDPELIAIFRKEADVHLRVVEEFVAEFNDSEKPCVFSDNVQRALHTLKGSAGMAGVTSVADLVSELEIISKEFRILGISADAAVISLLSRSILLLESGLKALDEGKECVLEGAGELIDEARDLFERYTRAQPSSEELQQVYRQSLSAFMDNVDILLDATAHLRAWDRDPHSEHIASMRDDLQTLVDSARNVELDVIADLAEQLIVIYQALPLRNEVVTDDIIDVLEAGHDGLLTMMDQLASQQTPVVSEPLLARLQSLSDDLESEPSVDEMTEAASGSLPQFEQTPPLSVAPEHDAAELTFDQPEPEISLENPQPVEFEMVVEESEDNQPDDELLAIFLDEASDNLHSASQALYHWLDQTDDHSHLQILHRALHTIKGGAYMAGITDIGDLSHELETLYEALTEHHLAPSQELINLLMRGHDALEEMLSAIRSHKEKPVDTSLLTAIQAFVAHQSVSDTPKQTDIPVAEETEAEAAEEPKHEPPLSLVTTEAEEGVTVFTQAPVLPEDYDPEMIEIFREEGSELLDEIEQLLSNWLLEPLNNDWPDRLMRSLHTLKGSARMAGLDELGTKSHDLEMLVQSLRENSQASQETIYPLTARHTELFSTYERVLGLMADHGESAPVDETAQPEQTVSAEPADNILSFPERAPVEADSATESGSSDAAARIAAPASANLDENKQPRQENTSQEMIRIPASLMEQLVNLAGETSISRARVEQQVSDFRYTLREMNTTIARLQEQLSRLDIETQAQILSRHEGELADQPDFDPLEMDRYSELTQLSRALVESATDLLDLKEALEDKTRDSETLLLQQSRVNTELQEGLMRTRMLPFNRILPRLRRIVRQVSSDLNKQVELQIVNADSEMDRTVMERMIAPLEHMLRNSIDHGIEKPEQRRSNGKSETGVINLDLNREGGDIVLKLSDDGRGLDLSAVHKKAIERGLLTADTEIADSELSRMIFQPGFTTSQAVTQISGRGVGLDVVNSELKQLGGHIDIHTEKDKGTEFEIRLPFTLSVNRALQVSIGEEQYAIPLNNLDGVIRMQASELELLYKDDNSLIEYAGRSYPLHYLGTLLSDRSPDFSLMTGALPVLLISAGDTTAALQIDGLIASREIVVKPLGPQFASVPGLTGATILGDGRVVIILDPAELMLSHLADHKPTVAEDNQPVQETEDTVDVNQDNNLVMIVDDSVTVRKVTGRLLKRNGYRTVTARDGVEAMALLQDHHPAVILLDIEMPRMDGFEVATAVRNHPELGNTPIIMITSRTGEKHRSRAQDIGVNEYMGKPFQEGILLETIGGFAKRHD